MNPIGVRSGVAPPSATSAPPYRPSGASTEVVTVTRTVASPPGGTVTDDGDTATMPAGTGSPFGSRRSAVGSRVTGAGPALW